MPSTKPFSILNDQVMTREGAVERAVALRAETLEEIKIYELRQALEQSQTALASLLGVSQSAVSQIERGEDIKLSTLQSYVEGLGAQLKVVAVFVGKNEEVEIPVTIGH